MLRTFNPSCTWQSRQPVGRTRKEALGVGYFGSWSEWQGKRYVIVGRQHVEALMPTLVLDGSRLAPESLGANDATNVAVQRGYASQVLGYRVWGCHRQLDSGEAGLR